VRPVEGRRYVLADSRGSFLDARSPNHPMSPKNFSICVN
jgi:hypothetical protein